jgi:hypothetical protein
MPCKTFYYVSNDLQTNKPFLYSCVFYKESQFLLIKSFVQQLPNIY